MRFFIFSLNLTIVAAIIFAAISDSRSFHQSRLSIIGRRDTVPEHTGYQCASTKYEMYEILDAIGIACPNPKPSSNFWYSYLDCDFPKIFPEAQKLGFPRKTLMAPIRGSFWLYLLSLSHDIFDMMSMLFCHLMLKFGEARHR
ncbi:BgTH12-03880 [Blumeria graminis f. sp. triticale]|uniref:BgtAc-30001-2 n=2 Tax=Blumeria graminis TaxID=34373 RepID=A0A9X9L9S2_BLUGR|nr:BgTH12-03880 [Blumeria graminis f. sp. triticale]VCU39941.1 BgtAc-30001-2 [Blumeria graminis f. sp. tritici]